MNTTNLFLFSRHGRYILWQKHNQAASLLSNLFELVNGNILESIKEKPIKMICVVDNQKKKLTWQPHNA